MSCKGLSFIAGKLGDSCDYTEQTCQGIIGSNCAMDDSGHMRCECDAYYGYKKKGDNCIEGRLFTHEWQVEIGDSWLDAQ